MSSLGKHVAWELRACCYPQRSQCDDAPCLLRSGIVCRLMVSVEWVTVFLPTASAAPAGGVSAGLCWQTSVAERVGAQLGHSDDVSEGFGALGLVLDEGRGVDTRNRGFTLVKCAVAIFFTPTVIWTALEEGRLDIL